MPGVPRPLFHPWLRARGRESADSCYPHDLSAVRPSWQSGHAEDSESVEGMVETDTVDEPLAATVGQWKRSRFGDALWRQRCIRELRSHLSKTWPT